MIEPKNVANALKEADWIKAVQVELNEFERDNVWTLVSKPQGKTIIGARWQSRSHIILDQVYVDDIIFGSTDEKLSSEFAEVMAKKFERSMMGELTFFSGLQVKQITDGIFVSQAKYIADMLMKYGFSECKPTKTLMSSSASIGTDPSGTDVNATLF
ncbi:uncharacterized mitochondrial protein AtMg00810-like [Lactuca sativa]|uniref:uncharacterized mitochondrial protein AtMg00810-like n=1 Tax=Lactuca sativa TaxID=4236 RepID=UPI000CD95453|nr:uncharacterized mitochondrial protein AtMg00810-like [Lactuca sativa]